MTDYNGHRTTHESKHLGRRIEVDPNLVEQLRPLARILLIHARRKLAREERERSTKKDVA